MAGLQTIINKCNGISIDRRKTVGIQFTRNEIPRVSQTPTKNPWKFALDMPSSLQYSQYRSLMEALDTLDRITPEVITFSNLPQLSWIFRYQGAMTSGQLATITVTSFVTLHVLGSLYINVVVSGLTPTAKPVDVSMLNTVPSDRLLQVPPDGVLV